MDSLQRPPQEIELKLWCEPGALAKVRHHPALASLLAGRARTETVVSRYYDTPTLRLQAAGVTLRLRRAGRRWLQTAKGSGSAVAGLHQRTEYEWPLARPRLDRTLLATTPWKKVFAAADGDLKPLFTTTVRRTSQLLVFADGTRATLCLDVGTIKAGPRRAPITEIEIELVSGDARRLYDLAQAFAADLPVSAAQLSKAERGYALAATGKFEAMRAADRRQRRRPRHWRRRGVRAPVACRRSPPALAAQVHCRAGPDDAARTTRRRPAVARPRRRRRARLGRLRRGNTWPDLAATGATTTAPRPGTAQGASNEAAQDASCCHRGSRALAPRHAHAARAGRHACGTRGGFRYRRNGSVRTRAGGGNADPARSSAEEAQQ